MKSKSMESQRPGVDWRPKCRRHGDDRPMESAILPIHYPAGSLPCPGFRCALCGEEVFLPEDTRASRDLARSLGLYGVEDSHERKLLQTGNSTTVSLDPQLVRDVLKGARPGSIVRVGRLGNRIVIEPVSADP